jgi:hypothetical protein
MTLYLDTSNLVKLYLDEPGSDENPAADPRRFRGRHLVNRLRRKTRATFARRRRERVLTASRCQDVADAFDLDWARFVVIGLTDELTHAAGR